MSASWEFQTGEQQARTGQVQPLEYFLQSGRPIRTIITYADRCPRSVGSARSANFNSPDRSCELLLDLMKEAGVELNHLGVLRIDGVTG